MPSSPLSRCSDLSLELLNYLEQSEEKETITNCPLLVVGWTVIFINWSLTPAAIVSRSLPPLDLVFWAFHLPYVATVAMVVVPSKDWQRRRRRRRSHSTRNQKRISLAAIVEELFLPLKCMTTGTITAIATTNPTTDKRRILITPIIFVYSNWFSWREEEFAAKDLEREKRELCSILGNSERIIGLDRIRPKTLRNILEVE